MSLGRVVRGIGFVFLAIVILLVGVWSSLAVWYQCDGNGLLRDFLTAMTAAFALVAVACLATRERWIVAGLYFASFGAFLVWWTTITPLTDRDWAPDVARSVTATIEGNRLVVDNVRNFTWRSDTDFDPVWEQRTYHLSHVTDVDMFLSYWMGEAIAHLIVSFGFDDAPRLAFSVEIRKEKHEQFSPIAGFFKQYELAIVAADERDVVRVRSNFRGEDVRLYRLKMTPDNARLLLLKYLGEANDLAHTPRFYNTLTTNCTTLVFGMVRAIYSGLPFDDRIVLSGYLPDYAYDVGALDTGVPFERLRELSHIDAKAAQAGDELDFSAMIREGVPAPHH